MGSNKLLEMVGLKFGRLVVIGRSADHVHPCGQRQARYRVQCACGSTIDVRGSSLRRGATQSCGCLRSEIMSEKFTKHGDSKNYTKSAEYRTWVGMIRRCESRNRKDYARYGGRGIAICDRWRNSFDAFLADMGRRPSEKHSIDRINNEGNYEPGNCRWATASQQRLNQRPRKKR